MCKAWTPNSDCASSTDSMSIAHVVCLLWWFKGRWHHIVYAGLEFNVGVDCTSDQPCPPIVFRFWEQGSGFDLFDFANL